MRLSVVFLMFLLYLVQTKEPVTVSVLVEAEEDDEGAEYVEIEMEIQRKSESLTTALSQAAKVVHAVSTAVVTYCENNGGKGKCKNAVDVSNYEIETKYQTIKREETFQGFVAKHQIVAKVFHTENIGQLVDQLLRAEVYKINSFSWKSDEEKSDEAIAMANALEKGESICGAFGQKIVAVTSVEQQEPEKPEGEEEEEEDQPATYKVNFTCEEKPISKKKK